MVGCDNWHLTWSAAQLARKQVAQPSPSGKEPISVERTMKAIRPLPFLPWDAGRQASHSRGRDVEGSPPQRQAGGTSVRLVGTSLRLVGSRGDGQLDHVTVVTQRPLTQRTTRSREASEVDRARHVTPAPLDSSQRRCHNAASPRCPCIIVFHLRLLPRFGEDARHLEQAVA